MEMLSVPVQIRRLRGGQPQEIDVTVNTGTAYTMLPREILTQLGNRPVDTRTFELVGSEPVDCELGQASVRLDGKEMALPVVFAPDDVILLLGATALEILGLGIDPTGQRLVPVRAMLK